MLTPEELADELKVRPETVKRWAREGRIPELRMSPKVRRFVLADVIAALREGRGLACRKGAAK